MDIIDAIPNKVATSDLITIDLEGWFPHGKRIIFDLKPLLYQELMLREKEFRTYLRDLDIEPYRGAHVAVTCTADAIVPTWAFMLVVLRLQPIAATVIEGTAEALENHLWWQTLAVKDWSVYADKKMVIKGCSKLPVPVFAYAEVTRRLAPISASIMYGEPCSTVPLYKRKAV